MLLSISNWCQFLQKEEGAVLACIASDNCSNASVVYVLSVSLSLSILLNKFNKFVSRNWNLNSIDWLKMFPETGPPSCWGKWRMIKNYLICFIYPIRLTYWRPCRQTFLPNDDAHRWDKLIRVCKNFWTMIVACVTRLGGLLDFGQLFKAFGNN